MSTLSLSSASSHFGPAPIRKMPNLHQKVIVRRGRKSDFGRIVDLHNFWSLPNLKGNFDRGFLLLETSSDQIKALHSDENSILVACVAGKVVGYLIATGKPEMLDKLVWQENQAAVVSAPGHRHITEMAVDPDFVGMGVGQTLYNELLHDPGKLHFSAYVATAPYDNKASIGFHRKMGFRTVATFRSPLFCGLEDYSSVLLYREKPIPI
jgi:ribosomal protein S18 acetylase RimI-like enzyme